MIEIVLQDPYVPEGVTARIEVSLYEVSYIEHYVTQAATLLFESERKIQRANYEAEQRADAASNG